MSNHLIQACIDLGFKEGALPYAPLVPDAETIAAMKEAQAGNIL